MFAANKQAPPLEAVEGEFSHANEPNLGENSGKINRLLIDAINALPVPTCQDKASDAIVDAGLSIRRFGATLREAAWLYSEMVGKWPIELRPSAASIEGAVECYTSSIPFTIPDKLPAISARKARRRRDVPAGYSAPAAVGDLATIAEKYLGKTLEESDGDHAKILVAIIDGMQRHGLAVDALGNFRDVASWSRVACDPVAFSEDLAFILRRDGMRVDAARVGETFRTLARVDATKRRQALTSAFLGKPSSKAGLAEVHRWIRAVTGEERPADIAAMQHWLWLVKARVAGRHGELHLMIVVFGLMQGTGKSQAVLRLCAPWAELFDPEISIETITDERNAPHLANCAIGLWDELGGLAKADMERLKHRMTATTVAFRPMRTNARIELPALMSFIGSSNRSIGELVKDSTGMRRFYEIRASDVVNWNEINTINYELLWQAINEDDKAPSIIHRKLIEAEQFRLVWRDPIQRWVEDEADSGWQSTSGLDGALIHEINAQIGTSTHNLYQRLRAWCVAAGEREPTRETMGRRLSELGWEGFRLPRSQGHGRGYRKTVIEETAVPTRFTVPRADREPCEPGEHPHIHSAESEGAEVVI